MKKIETKEDKDKKEKRKQWIIGIILVTIMILSTAGFAITNQDKEDNTQKTINGIDFYFQNNQWKIIINEQIFSFQNLPNEIENISININATLDDFYNKPLYFVNLQSGYYEILQNLQPIILRYQEACLNQNECKNNLPIKTCEDNNIIIFKESNITTVSQDKNCIIITGDSIKGADTLLYKILNIN